MHIEKTLLEILEEIKIQEQQLAEKKAQVSKIEAERHNGIVGRVLATIQQHGITAAELGFIVASRNGKSQSQKLIRSSVQPKYPESKLWSGKGRKPAWVQAALAEGTKLRWQKEKT